MTLSQTKNLLAWVAIWSFLVMFIAQNDMEGVNPVGNGPWPEVLPRPSSFDFPLRARNYSLLIALPTGAVSLPRRKAIAALVLTLAYAFWTYWVFVHY